MLVKLIVSFCLLIVVASSCRKTASWDTNWVAPLINDTLDLSNLVNDSTLDVSGGFYNVNLKRTILDVGVGDFVAIPDTTIEQDLTLTFPSVTVPPGTQFVDAVEENTFDLQDLELKKIILKNGVIDLEIENPIQEQVKLDLEFPGVTKNNVILTKTYIVPAAIGTTPGVLKRTIDMSDYSIDLTGENGNSFNILQSKVTVSTLSTANPVVVTNQDHTIVKAKFKNVVLKYARGYFGNRIISDTTDFNIDFFENIAGGTIDLPATSVKLKIENSIKFDARAQLNYLKNVNHSGNVVSLNGDGIGTTFLLDQPTGTFNTLQPSFIEVLFNSGNSNIENYFENLGYKHTLAYQIQINPWGNTSAGWNEIFENSKLKMTVEANLPLSIQADNLTIKDTFDVKLKQTKDKSRITSGTFVLDTDNAFPFTGNVKLHLLNKNKQELHLVESTHPILSSLYGALNTAGIQHQLSQSEFVISEEMVENLDKIKFIVVDFELNTPNPLTQTNQMVGIPANAFLGIKLKANFNLKAVI